MSTLVELRDRVKRELDLEDEVFIRDSELNDWINDAIDRVERVILNLHQDYFLTPATVTLVSGQAEYNLPTGIWAQKVRLLAYDNGAKRYLIRKIKQLSDTINWSYTTQGNEYKYLITNDATNGLKLKLFPTPDESGAFITLWHIRNAKELTLDADVLDIPEGESYIVQYCKDQAINKERMTPDAGPSNALKQEEQILMEALANRIIDEDDEIPLDLTFYEGHV